MLKLTAMEKSKFSSEQLKKLIDTTTTIEKKGKVRSFKHKKPPRVPACVGRLPIKSATSKRKLAKAKVILQKGPKEHLEQLYCSTNQNSLLHFIEKAEELLLKKVENVQVKERLIALQNIRKLASQMQRCINSKIHQEIKKDQKGIDEFYDLMAKREERHFRIDRIIRYLAEP
ncbi:MAG: hypothetical protein JSS30_02675 [Verrucomicrobia bacterium]|nr:hypothetical protein [Verrucomicrobiota bacterium]